jgi:uncharacterized damage-inducible protein DinB
MATPVTHTFFKRYLDRVKGDNYTELLQDSYDHVLSELKSIDEEKSEYRYAPEKWSIKEMLSHIIDVERVMAFRILWFSRGMSDILNGFDDVIWEQNSEAARQPFKQMIADYSSTRASTVALIRTIPSEAFQFKGVASDVEFTVDALIRVIIGHEQHHMNVLKERYLV